MLGSLDIANYFLSLTDEDSGEIISNLKVQKLVYYAQGFHLALYKRPLFNEIIEAWTHGPVIPELYHAYKSHGSGPIPSPTNLDLSKYNSDIKELLDEIYAVYGQYSAWKLREMTHSEPTWINAYNRSDKIISHEELIEYFETQITNGKY